MSARRKSQEAAAEKKGPDCATCIDRGDCRKAQAGHFCPRWRSEEPEKEGTDPNEAWMRGEQVDF